MMETRNKLALFFDGTRNDARNSDDFTNVKLLKDLVIPHCEDGSEEILTKSIYFKGPGTHLGSSVTGKLFGEDYPRILEEALQAVVEECAGKESLPEFYIFGFSRGACVAHIMSWILAEVRIPRRLADISKIVDAYMAHDDDALRKRGFLEEGPRPVIRMLGLWDRVSAPFDKYNLRNFRGSEVSPIVKSVYHAMSLDERRIFFPVSKYALDAPNVHQCWFSGVHSEVGGGYSDDKTLSNIALDWMADNAVREGLPLYATPPSPTPNYLALTLHDPAGKENSPRTFEGESIHSSVKDRLAQDPTYKPLAYNFIA